MKNCCFTKIIWVWLKSNVSLFFVTCSPYMKFPESWMPGKCALKTRDAVLRLSLKESWRNGKNIPQRHSKIVPACSLLPLSSLYFDLASSFFSMLDFVLVLNPQFATKAHTAKHSILRYAYRQWLLHPLIFCHMTGFLDPLSVIH